MHVFLEALVVKSQWVNERGARADAKVVCRSSENESPLAAAPRRALLRYPTFLVQSRKKWVRGCAVGSAWQLAAHACAKLPVAPVRFKPFMQSPSICPAMWRQLPATSTAPAVHSGQRRCCPNPVSAANSNEALSRLYCHGDQRCCWPMKGLPLFRGSSLFHSFLASSWRRRHGGQQGRHLPHW